MDCDFQRLLIRRIEECSPRLRLGESAKLAAAAQSACIHEVDSIARHYNRCTFFAHRTHDVAATVLLKEFIELRRFRGSPPKAGWYFLCNELDKGGEDYIVNVSIAAFMAKCLILVASQATPLSYFVPMEVDIALALRTPIVVVHLDDVVLGNIHPMLADEVLRESWRLVTLASGLGGKCRPALGLAVCEILDAIEFEQVSLS